MTTVKILKENDQDFEWYPTTQEIIECVKKHINAQTYGGYSILDIGAGDGRVLKALASGRNAECYSIEKSEILRNKQDKEIIPLGCDFWQNTLIDKEMDFIFCNPPYSEYEAWCEKIIKEASTEKGIYFVIPERYKQSAIINQALKARKLENKIYSLGSFNFLNAERGARAKVEVVFVKIENERYSDNVSAFDLFLDENFRFDATSKFNQEAQRERIKKELINSKNYIESLVELYQADMQKLMSNFQAIASLDSEILEEIGFKKETLRKSIRSRIEGLKNLYWQELFNRYEPITSKFIANYRNTILEKLSSRRNIDFNIGNIYAITIWFLKNASGSFSEQLLDFYLFLAEKDNLRAYKSNIKFTSDKWKYMRSDELKDFLRKEKDARASLDYRLVLSQKRFVETNYYGACFLSYSAVDFLNDIQVLARNLGFAVNNQEFKRGYREYPICSGEKNYIYSTDGDILVEYKIYKNGNIHIRINQELMKAINIEAGRLLGWLRSPAEASSELNMKEAEARQYFGKLVEIPMSSIKMLVA